MPLFQQPPLTQPVYARGQDIELTGDMDDLRVDSYMADLYSESDVNLTGVVKRDGHCLYLINVGTFNITLVNNSVSSGPGNKFFFRNDSNRILGPRESVMFMNKDHSGKHGWWELLPQE